MNAVAARSGSARPRDWGSSRRNLTWGRSNWKSSWGRRTSKDWETKTWGRAERSSSTWSTSNDWSSSNRKLDKGTLKENHASLRLKGNRGKMKDDWLRVSCNVWTTLKSWRTRFRCRDTTLTILEITIPNTCRITPTIIPQGRVELFLINGRVASPLRYSQVGRKREFNVF